MVDLADTTMVPRASAGDATPTRARHGSGFSEQLLALDAVDTSRWRALADRAIEPNGYYLPDWELAVNASAPGRTGASALAAQSGAALIGLMPVVSLSHAFKIPLPALISAHPYGTLCTPLLDRDRAEDAAAQLMQAARDNGAHALVLREVSLDGAAMKAVNAVLRGDGIRPRVLSWHLRACLNATRGADELLTDALSTKKLKELRRQRNRLADEHGEVSFEVARTMPHVVAATETFLALEASGWKGRRGTALAQVAGDAAFIRQATSALV